MMRIAPLLREQIDTTRGLARLAAVALLLGAVSRAVPAQQPLVLVHGGWSSLGSKRDTGTYA